MTEQTQPMDLNMFMIASPFYVDIDDEQKKETIIARIDTLPENIKQTLMAEETASLIWNLCVTTYNLNEDQVRSVAHVIRDVMTGEESAANFHQLLSQRTGVDETVSTQFVKVLTQKLISPNYFQISQLFEKKHSKETTPVAKTAPRQPLAGRPLESLEQKRATIAAATATPGKPTTSMGDWAGELEQEDASTQIVANKPSRNVVDLRKSSEPLPTKLPPTPPVVSRPE